LIKPVGLMAAPYRDIRDGVFERFPYMRSSAFERRILFERKDGPQPRMVAAGHGPLSASSQS
jgi:hypothetical protein